jgi:hypothetical protein
MIGERVLVLGQGSSVCDAALWHVSLECLVTLDRFLYAGTHPSSLGRICLDPQDEA